MADPKKGSAGTKKPAAPSTPKGEGPPKSGKK